MKIDPAATPGDASRKITFQNLRLGGPDRPDASMAHRNRS